MTALDMEHLDGYSMDDYTPNQAAPPMMIPVVPHREKTKRPQLSCNPCRARKVKCDRIQPCTACSLHQIAEICQYDLSESERQPILQAEALKEKDKAIAHLQRELSCLRGESIKQESADDDFADTTAPKGRGPPRALKRPAGHDDEAFGVQDEFNFYGHHGPTNVADEFSHLTFERLPQASPLVATTGADVFAFHMATSHPFPTLWTAKDDTSTLIKLLPSEEDLYFYIDSFQRRCQASSFPLVPHECTHGEVQAFLMDVEHNAALRPDHLALVFTTLALGLQDGVFDRCGEKWVSAAVDRESKKGDVYIAAAMQCLRLSSFLNRPTLLAVEALMMMGPYLTNSGKFLDASALFGGTIRLAQGIDLHHDPEALTPRRSSYEISVRKSLWWCMLHMDQQYSMTLGRPLGISSMGDCPSPEPHDTDIMVQSLSNYLSHFTLLGRQIISSGPLNNTQIDKYSDDLLALQRTIPDAMQFDVSWLNLEKSVPAWPFDAQAALLHSKTHNLLILLNRQRVEADKPSSTNSRFARASVNANHVSRGRERVLESCRAILTAFEFIASRARAALMSWNMGQMSFNAAMLLTLSMLETGETQDLLPVQHVYSTFLEINKLGIHKLAGAAVDRLGTLMKEFCSEDSANQTVMGQKGMILLEDHGLPGILPENAMPLHEQIVGGSINPGIRRTATDIGHRAEATHSSRKRGHRKGEASTRDSKSQHQRPSKKGGKSSPHRQQTDRRFSDSVTPVPSSQRRKLNRSTPTLNAMTQHPGQSVFSATSTPTVQHELFMPQTFEGFPAQGFAGSPEQPPHQRIPDPQLHINLDSIHPALQPQQQQTQQHRHQMTHPHQRHIHPQQPQQPQQQQQQHPHSLPHRPQSASEPTTALPTGTGDAHSDLTFSSQTTPYSNEFFDDSMSHGLVDAVLNSQFDGPPFSAPPFPLSDMQGGFGGGHF